jgi:hypothetical protein
MTTRCIYTSLFGDYEEISEQNFVGQENYRLICFSDVPRPNSTWEVRVIDKVLIGDIQRSSRLPKILPHIFLSEFEESIYIDNSVKLLEDPFLYFGKSAEPFHILRHSFHSNLQREFQEIFAKELDEPFRILEQFSHYKSDEMKISEIPVLWGGILYRKHNSPEIVKFAEEWWLHLARYSRRDQLGLAYLANLNSRLFHITNIDNHESNFHRWPVTKRGISRSELWRIDLSGQKNELFGSKYFGLQKYGFRKLLSKVRALRRLRKL